MAVLVIVGADIPPIKSAIKGTFLDGIIFTGQFSDLTDGWYAKVGRSLFITVALSPVLNRAFSLAAWPQRWFWLRPAFKKAAVNQNQLNQLYTG